MLEPSKPRPSVKMSSLYSVRVVVKCCQLPGRSVNLKSTSLNLAVFDQFADVRSVFFVFGHGEFRNDETRMTKSESMTK